IFSLGSMFDIQVERQTEQQAKPAPLMIREITTVISFGARMYPALAIVISTAPINVSLYLLIRSAILPARGRQNREHRFISPPTKPMTAADAPMLSVNPVISGVTSMGLDI